MFAKLKQQRRIATRYDNAVLSLESFLSLAAARLWLESVVNTPGMDRHDFADILRFVLEAVARLVHRRGMDIPALYADLIRQIGDGTGMADSLLHVHAGMAVLLATRVLTGYRLSTPVPLLVVVVAELANEVLDRIHWGSWRWADTSLDIVNTLFWPTMLFVGLRIRNRLDRRAPVAD